MMRRVAWFAAIAFLFTGFSAAAAAQSVEACESEEGGFLGLCEENLRAHGVDVSVCEVIREEMIPHNPENCPVSAYEAEKAEKFICDAFGTPLSQRDECYRIVGRETRNRSICEIGRSSIHLGCRSAVNAALANQYHQQAQQTGNATHCLRIRDLGVIPMNLSRDNCFKKVPCDDLIGSDLLSCSTTRAETVSTPQKECSKIGNASLRGECWKRFDRCDKAGPHREECVRFVVNGEDQPVQCLNTLQGMFPCLWEYAEHPSVSDRGAIPAFVYPFSQGAGAALAFLGGAYALNRVRRRLMGGGK